MPTSREPEPADLDDDENPEQREHETSGLIPGSDPEPDTAAKYSVTEEEVVTREDRDPDDRSR